MVDIPRIDFLRDKYGSEILVDIGRIESLPGYILHDQPHRLSFYEIAFITEGGGEFALDFAAYPVEGGRVFFTSPGQIRQWRLTTPARGYTLFFTGGFLAEFFSDPLFLHKLQFFHDHRRASCLLLTDPHFDWCLSRLGEMEAEITSLHGDSIHILRAVLYQLLVSLNRYYGAAHGVEPDTEAHSLVNSFRSLLEERFRELHSVRDYARLLDVTPGHLSDLARKHAGASAGALIRDRIIVEAKRLILYSGRSCQWVATHLGYDDPSYFGRLFKRETGLTPAAYRRRTLEKHQNPRSS